MKKLISILFLFLGLNLFSQSAEDIQKMFLNEIKTGNVQKVKMYLNTGKVQASGATFDVVNFRYDQVQNRYSSKPFLIDAIEANQTEIVRLLLDNGADVNCKVTTIKRKKMYRGFESYSTYDGEEKKYALEYALEMNNSNIINEFVNRKAYLDVGKSVIIKNGNLQQIKYFESVGMKINFDSKALNTAINSGNLELIEYYISKGAKVDDACFMSAVNENNISLCKFLLKNGANINSRDQEYQFHAKFYAICRAVSNGNLEMVKFLVENGANLDVLCTYVVNDCMGDCNRSQGLYDLSSKSQNRYFKRNQAVSEYLIFAKDEQKKIMDEKNKIIVEKKNKADKYGKKANEYLDKDNIDSAVIYIKKANEIVPNSYSLENYYINKSNFYYQNKDLNNAIKHLRLAQKVNNKQHIYYNIAEYYLHFKEFEKTEVFCDSVMTFQNNNIWYLFRGISRIGQNKNKLGEDDLKTLIDKSSDKKMSYYAIALRGIYLDNPEFTLINLKKSLELGFDEFELFINNKSFDFVKDTKEFQKLMKKYNPK